MNRILRRVAKRLRYRPLPELAGKEVVIETAASAPQAVGAMLAKSFPLPLRFSGPQERFIVASLAKYCMLDLTFAVDGVEWQPSDVAGTSLLKELGFASHPDELPEDQRWPLPAEDDPTCISELAEDIGKDQAVLRLFLDALPRRELADHLKEVIKAGKGHLFQGGVSDLELILEGFLPHEMAVSDACLTNAPFVWFHKHCYL